MKTGTVLAFAAAVIVVTSCGPDLDVSEGELKSPLSSSLVISQVYGGGGNAGSVYTNDFIEIFNRGNATVDVSAMSVQYATAAGSTWSVTTLSGSIPPGAYYLVQEAQGAGGTTALPTPDATGTIGMSATAGKVALVSSTTALSGACPTTGTIVDFVGFGSTTCFEGTASTQAPSNVTSVIRRAAGCTETDQNNGDFTTINPPTPRNSAAATTSCSPSGPGLANPNPVGQGGETLLTVSVTPGNVPVSTGIAVEANLTNILGSSTQTFFDDGSNGDAAAGDLVFSWTALVTDSVSIGAKNLATRITDAEARVTSSGSIVLTVATNAAPVAADETGETAEDVGFFLDVLANDTDPDSDALHVSAISVAPADGTAVVVSNGAGIFYTPDTGVTGTDVFEYRLTDAKGESDFAQVTVYVVSPDAPTANADVYPATEDQVLNVAAPGVLTNDTDPLSAPITAALLTQPANGAVVLSSNGSFSYTPDPEFSGVDTFTYAASNALPETSAPATVTINVADVNDTPVATDDAYAITEDVMRMEAAGTGVLANDVDSDSTLTAILVTNVTNGALTLSTNGAFTYVPDLNFNGGDSFTYKANDGNGDSNVATVTFNFTAVNDPPVGAAESYPVDEDGMLAVNAANGVLANDSDVESAVTAVLMTDAANGTLALAADGSFTYEPDANFNGADTFVYRASDGVLSSSPVTVTIDVAPVNDAPTAVNDAYTTDEDTPLAVATNAGLLLNDGDIDGDTLSPVVDAQPASGAVVVATNGGFTYTPGVNFEGNDAFTYHVTDGAESSSIVTVSLTVTAVNDAPLAPTAISPTGGEEVAASALEFTWSAAVDPDGDTVSYRLELLRGGLLYAQAEVDGTTGTIPGQLDKGDYTWRVLANDGDVSGPFSTPQSFTLVRGGNGGGGGGGLFGCSTTGATGATSGGGAGALLGLAALALFRRSTRSP